MSIQPPSPAANALLDATARRDAGSWLIPGGQSTLAVGIARDHPGSIVHWQPVDFRERGAAEAVPNLRIDAPGTLATNIGAVVVAAPPDRDLARRWLLVAREALAPDGRLFIAGANREGIRSVIGDATKLFGPAKREDSRSKGRIAVFAGGGGGGEQPAWVDEPGISPGTWREFALVAGETSAPMLTQAGVFAGAKVDTGTQLLLDALPDTLSGRVLDAGCGAGAIGVAAAYRGADLVDMTDVNLLAIQAANENIRRLGLVQCRAYAGDLFSGSGNERYDLIVSNPPFHRGKAIDLTVADRLIAGAPGHLRPGGSLLIVANAFLAYGKRMERVFTRVETVAATRQFQVQRASDPR